MAQHPHVIQGDTLCRVEEDLSVIKQLAHGLPWAVGFSLYLPRGGMWEQKGACKPGFIWLLAVPSLVVLTLIPQYFSGIFFLSHLAIFQGLA